VSEVAKGFRPRRFFDLSDRDKRDILKLMARVAEQAYRRGVQQGAGLAGKPSFSRRPMGIAVPSVARPVAVDRPPDDDHQPRSARRRMWRAIARAGVIQERRRCRLVASGLDHSQVASRLDRVHTRTAPPDPRRDYGCGASEGVCLSAAALRTLRIDLLSGVRVVWRYSAGQRRGACALVIGRDIRPDGVASH
jgi:hypothetical protein